MLYRCYRCLDYSFEEVCPECGEDHIDSYAPLDPKHYREFKYTRQGFVKDLFVGFPRFGGQSVKQDQHFDDSAPRRHRG
jgi:rRNA maturation protein Nop10